MLDVEWLDDANEIPTMVPARLVKIKELTMCGELNREVMVCTDKGLMTGLIKAADCGGFVVHDYGCQPCDWPNIEIETNLGLVARIKRIGGIQR